MATFEIPGPEQRLEGSFNEQEKNFKDFLTNHILRSAKIELQREKDVLERLVFYTEKHHLEDFFEQYEKENQDAYEHSLRVALVGVDLALQDALSEESVEGVGVGDLLHDIGKLDISKTILDEPKELTLEQRIAIEEHPKLGLVRLIRDKRFGSAVAFAGVREITAFHHGDRKKAYPLDLAHKEDLPTDFFGLNVKGWNEQMRRIVDISAAADSYDALTSKRVYRSPETSGQAVFNRISEDQNLPAELIARVASRFPKRAEAESALQTAA